MILENTVREDYTMKKPKMILTFFVIMVVMFGGCEGKQEPKEWTYELLEKEFGGIIELDFESTKKSLDLLEEHEYVTCGFITEKRESSMFGKELYNITITDDLENSYSGNTINVSITQNAFDKVSEGDFIYASGTMNYVDYGGAKSDNSVSMSCHVKGYISPQTIENSVPIKEYIENAREISEETYFQVKGVIIQDGENYMLYESKEKYKEDKFGYIRLNFTEEQHNLNGKTVTIIGKPDTYLYMGLIECSISD